MNELLDRFVAKTRKLANGCVIWTASKYRDGYGQIRIAGKPAAAHRTSFELFIGPIPAELWVLHNCPAGDDRACVNPLHLWLGTAQDNTDDMIRKGRMIVGDHRGTRHGMAKLKDADIIEIRRRRAAGETLAAIAADFHVDQSLVSMIALRKIWRHLP